jgi:Leucine-rich repeat (LRR) protein
VLWLVKLTGLRNNGEPFNRKVDEKIEDLEFSHLSLKEIDLSPLTACKQLMYIDLEGNNLTSIDLSPLVNCQRLVELSLMHNELTTIDLSPLASCQNFVTLYLSDNKLTKIDLSPLAKCQKITVIDLYNNSLTDLNLTPLKSSNELNDLFINDEVVLYWQGNSLPNKDRLPYGLQEHYDKLKLTQ